MSTTTACKNCATIQLTISSIYGLFVAVDFYRTEATTGRITYAEVIQGLAGLFLAIDSKPYGTARIEYVPYPYTLLLRFSRRNQFYPERLVLDSLMSQFACTVPHYFYNPLRTVELYFPVVLSSYQDWRYCDDIIAIVVGTEVVRNINIVYPHAEDRYVFALCSKDKVANKSRILRSNIKIWIALLK